MGSLQSESVPVGYRFHPTDEELVDHYLKLKMLGKDSKVRDAIAEVEICKYEPWDLPNLSALGSEDNVWFFFCPRDLKYAKSPRFKRMTKKGFWKATGKDRDVRNRVSKEVIGTKKTLVFHKGRVPNGVRTSWVMHEYHPLDIPPGQKAFVLCRLKKKPDENGTSTCLEVEPSDVVAPDIGNVIGNYSTPEIYDHLDVGSIFRSNQPPEYDLSSMWQQMQTEQGPPYIESSIADSFYSNGQEDNALNLFETVWNEHSFGEPTFLLQSGSIPLELPTGIYAEDGVGLSSDTDTETAQARNAQVRGVASSFSDYASTKECRQMRMVPAPCRTILSSNRDLKIKENTGLVVDELDTSSVDSETDMRLEINCLFLDSQEPVNIRTCKSNYQPTSQNSISQRVAPRRIQLQSGLLHKAEAIKKEREATERDSAVFLSHQNSVMETAKKCSQATTAKLSSKPRVNGSACSSDRKGSFIVLDTPSLNRRSSPPSVYFRNALLGSLFFIIILWELFIYGTWC